MSDIQQLPVVHGTTRPAPRRIVRPCEYGMKSAVQNMETQMGSVETYNRICDIAAALKRKIDAGDGVQAQKMWATDPEYIYPAGHKP